eukprot:108811-Amphidinium_carterae.1
MLSLLHHTLLAKELEQMLLEEPKLDSTRCSTPKGKSQLPVLQLLSPGWRAASPLNLGARA